MNGDKTLEIWNSLATVVSCLAALITIILVKNQYSDSKIVDTKHFWYRSVLLHDNLEEYNECLNNILDITNNVKKNRVEKLLEWKDEFNKLRLFFYKTEFFDKSFYEGINNFINTCEEECMENPAITEEEIFRMDNIILKSLYEFELNEYKDFTIKY